MISMALPIEITKKQNRGSTSAASTVILPLTQVLWSMGSDILFMYSMTNDNFAGRIFLHGLRIFLIFGEGLMCFCFIVVLHCSHKEDITAHLLFTPTYPSPLRRTLYKISGVLSQHYIHIGSSPLHSFEVPQYMHPDKSSDFRG